MGRDFAGTLGSSGGGGTALTIGDLEDRGRNMDQRDLGVSFFTGFFSSLERGGTSDSLEGLVALTEDRPSEGFVALVEDGPLEGFVALK
jgi:hypothetical protein